MYILPLQQMSITTELGLENFKEMNGWNSTKKLTCYIILTMRS